MDPLEGRTFEPATLHKYLYAAANPANHVDPSGLDDLGTTLTVLNIALRVITIGFNAYGAVRNTVEGGLAGSAAFAAFQRGELGNGLGYATYSVARFGLAAFNVLGIRAAVTLPLPPPGGGAFQIAFAGKGGLEYFATLESASPELVAWANDALLPALVSSLPTYFMTGERNPAQDKKLGSGEIKKLKDGGVDPEELKGGRRTGQLDLYKDADGNIYVKPKGGSGPGDPTGLNINDF
jgi:hypothetical protein